MSGVGNAPATMVLCIKSPAQQIDSINWWRPVVHWWNGVNIKKWLSIMTQMMTQALSYRSHDEQYLIWQHWFFIVMNIIIIRILQKKTWKNLSGTKFGSHTIKMDVFLSSSRMITDSDYLEAFLSLVDFSQLKVTSITNNVIITCLIGLFLAMQ